MNHKRKCWFGQQTWSHVFFAHWPVNKTVLQPFIPYPFRLDTTENSAWLSMVAFQAMVSRFRYSPKGLAFRPFWQVNIRTYIRFGKERGIYFFTLYSNDQVAVKFGSLPGLPYVHIPMSISENNASIFLKSEKERDNFLVSHFDLSLQRKDILVTKDLHDWLTDRDTLYFRRKNKLIKGSLSHSPWQLYNATGHVKIKGAINKAMSSKLNEPLLMAAAPKTAYIHPFKTIGYV